MPEAENTALARRWFDEVWNVRREATVRELLHPDAVGHLEGLVSRGIQDFLAARSFILRAFPDLHITVEETVAQGAIVAVRWSVQATHGGEFLGIAATSRAVQFRGITWLRFSEGRIIEGWDVWNQGRLVTELQTAVDTPKR
jgi:steroid delta-isomerase-like uncharacterized protein